MDNKLRPLPQDENIVGKYAGQIFNWRNDPFLFLRDMWGLTPQPVRPEYQEQWEEVCRATGEHFQNLKQNVNAEWFGVNEEGKWVWYDFEKGKHLTWQQTLIFLGLKKAKHKEVSRHISIRSGHGIGKSATVSWIVLWFLICFYQSQVPVTAPTSQQMNDVLWKELSIWINKMPEEIAFLYDWSSQYVRMKYDPEAWFARARTSTKENTEAIAGVHADDVLIAVDEASGVPEQVYNTAEGSLTSGNVFVILIGNPTRLTGYFHDSHNKNKDSWLTYSFSSEESPVVDHDYVKRIARRHGEASDEYRIRVLGRPPSEEAMDDKGYIQLVPADRIRVRPSGDENVFIGRTILGVDPAGEGKDMADFVARDRFKAINLKTLKTSNAREIAEMILTFIDRYNIAAEDVIVDALGVGTDVGKEIAIATRGRHEIYTVLSGNRPIDEEEYNGKFFQRLEKEKQDGGEDLFLNLRALMSFRMRDWLIGGGDLVDGAVDNSLFKEQVTVLKYKRSLHGNRIQIMPKTEMKKLGIPSPDKADALALTFMRDLNEDIGQTEEERRAIEAEDQDFDPHDPI